MTDLAFYLIAAAAVVGTILAVLQLRTAGPPPIPWPAGAAHGLLGAAGLAVLVLALRAPAPPDTMGTNSFRIFAALVLGCALLVGLWIIRSRLSRGHFSTTIIGVHATLAITGCVLLAAYVTLG